MSIRRATTSDPRPERVVARPAPLPIRVMRNPRGLASIIVVVRPFAGGGKENLL
jgi:hypothetical protein